MPRPQKRRWVGFEPDAVTFVPRPGLPPNPHTIVLTVDELEAIRLADLESMSHEQSAAEMGVSRATFGRIVGQARAKVAAGLVEGRPISIGGGVVSFRPGRHRRGPGGHGRGYGPHGPRDHRRPTPGTDEHSHTDQGGQDATRRQNWT